MQSNNESKIYQIWNELYPQFPVSMLDELMQEVKEFKQKFPRQIDDKEWYKDAVVYSLYVDLFNGTFAGLIDKLSYLQSLGVNCLWLLPILDSPMRDGGFDIRRYDRVRRDLLGLSETATDAEQQAAFKHFLDEAHKRNIRVIFDIAMNHVSDEHEWFKQAKLSKDNPYRDYFIWNKDTNLYKETRLLFKGMVNSNWEKCGDEYFFHRFYEFQPDLNYRNPKVPLAMVRHLMYWLSQDVDGFRADAIPFIWKEDGTNCENLEGTHTIIKFYRAILDIMRPGTLLLAEACQPPVDVVKYFGDQDECHAAYHFPLMPMIYKSIATQNREPIIDILKPENTPSIAPRNQWFTFLRNHDELTLEMVSAEDRKIINDYYKHDQRWDFRVGEGIASRLSELMQRNPQKIALAYSIMFTLPGTPIVYYGDEFGRLNDEKFYYETGKMTGYFDARFFVRGKVDWTEVEKELSNADSFSSVMLKTTKSLIDVRNKTKAFGRGTMEWVDVKAKEILAFYRQFNNEKVLVLNNLSDKPVVCELPDSVSKIDKDAFGQKLSIINCQLTINPYQYFWIFI